MVVAAMGKRAMEDAEDWRCELGEADGMFGRATRRVERRPKWGFVTRWRCRGAVWANVLYRYCTVEPTRKV